MQTASLSPSDPPKFHETSIIEKSKKSHKRSLSHSDINQVIVDREIFKASFSSKNIKQRKITTPSGKSCSESTKLNDHILSSFASSGAHCTNKEEEVYGLISHQSENYLDKLVDLIFIANNTCWNISRDYFFAGWEVASDVIDGLDELKRIALSVLKDLGEELLIVVYLPIVKKRIKGFQKELDEKQAGSLAQELKSLIEKPQEKSDEIEKCRQEFHSFIEKREIILDRFNSNREQLSRDLKFLNHPDLKEKEYVDVIKNYDDFNQSHIRELNLSFLRRGQFFYADRLMKQYKQYEAHPRCWGRPIKYKQLTEGEKDEPVITDESLFDGDYLKSAKQYHQFVVDVKKIFNCDKLPIDDVHQLEEQFRKTHLRFLLLAVKNFPNYSVEDYETKSKSENKSFTEIFKGIFKLWQIELLLKLMQSREDAFLMAFKPNEKDKTLAELQKSCEKALLKSENFFKNEKVIEAINHLLDESAVQGLKNLKLYKKKPSESLYATIQSNLTYLNSIKELYGKTCELRMKRQSTCRLYKPDKSIGSHHLDLLEASVHEDKEASIVPSLDKQIPSGLKNIGNSCYLNAVLQNLCFNASFRKAILDYAPNQSSSDEQKNYSFIEELKKIVRFQSDEKIQDHETSSTYLLRHKLFLSNDYGPFSFENCNNEGEKRARLNAQNDAAELLGLIIEKCRLNDSTPFVQRTSRTFEKAKKILDGKKVSDIDIAMREIKQEGMDNPSSLLTLSFPIESKRESHHLEKLLEEAFSPKEANLKTTMGGYNTFRIDEGELKGCEVVEWTDKPEITSLPDTLPIQLMRFKSDLYGKTTKLRDQVTLPKEGIIDLSPYLSSKLKEELKEKKESATYRISGYIIHRGQKASSGHYISRVISEKGAFTCDDATISELKGGIDAFLSEGEAYIIFAERVKQESSSNKENSLSSSKLPVL